MEPGTEGASAHGPEEHERPRGQLVPEGEWLRAVLEQAPLPIVVLDPDGTVRLWNRAAGRLFGWSAAEALGQPLPIVPPEQQSEFARLRARVLAGETLLGAKVVRRRKDGSPLALRLSAAPLRDASGAASGVVAVLEDASELEQLEQQLRHAQKMEAVGRLAGGVAHDFNNLLTAILGYCELAGTARLPAEREAGRPLGEIRRAAERAARLTGQLLAFSRRQYLEPRRIALHEVVAHARPMIEPLLGERVELRLELAPEPGAVYADPGQLEQALINLCVNARDAMPQGGTLTIRTREVVLDRPQAAALGLLPGVHEVLEVSDTGVGMDAATLARAFEPFFTTKEVGKGTGLGLSMVYGFVRQSGGAVAVCSAPGQGACFTIYLPRASEGPEAAPEPAPASRGAPLAAETLAAPGAALVVEDDAPVRELMRAVLAAQGWQVLAAADGVQALERARAHTGAPLRLLVTDVVLPRLDGPELARQVAGLHPGVKALFVSGYAGEPLAPLTGEQAPPPGGGALLLRKPFTPAALLAKVEEALQSRPAPGEGRPAGTAPPA
ncbi:MAG: hypothetical protein KatS3mg102_1676 [Planctomycetota bacterium]|nr:MAG: hypothetical protein KatS3mg102_1676 [Planctomycetota bacterium]